MSSSLIKQKVIKSAPKTCYHCGEDCKEETIFDDKSFCCEGCKMVYEILNTSDLCDFYSIEKNAGISLKNQKKQRYAWLDDEDVIKQLIDFQDKERTKITFHVPQIHCASCLWLLENLYKLNPIVQNSRVNFLKKEVYLTFNHNEGSLREIVELLALIGYAPSIQLDQLDKDKKQTVDRKLIYQIGLAGFTFGNIMLLSFPEYLGLGEAQFQIFFGYLSIFLVIPAILYSSQHYLKSAWFGLRQGNLNIDVPITIGILTLFGRSTFEIITHTGAGYLDSLAGLILFLLAGRWFQQKTYHHLSFDRDYKSYFPVSAVVLQDNETTSIALNKLKIGDRILVRNQEIIPADGLLVEGHARIDYSFVTGEANPVSKKIGDKIFAGGRQTGTGIEIVITKAVNQSYLIQLWNEDTFQEKEKADASVLADKVGKNFTYVILGIAAITLLYWLPKDLNIAINAFTAVLIIACPCAVALSIPFTLGNTIRILARKGFYVKNTQVLENIQQVSAIVFDKTGTITDTTEFDTAYNGRFLSDKELSFIKKIVEQSNHPLSKAIHQNLISHADTNISLTNFQEIEGQGLMGQFDDFNIKIGSKAFVNAIKNEERIKGGKVFIQINNEVLGYFSIQPKYRNGLQTLFDFFQNFASTHLISGDNDSERQALLSYFKNENLHFQQTPKEKLNYIQSLQNNNETVIMIGDGLNDAGALKQSDIGIVISENTNNFTPACDAILNSEKFEQLPHFITIAQKSIKLVYFAYAFAFVYNVIGLSFAVQGLLSPIIAAILMPLSSISIVVFGIVTSNWQARSILRS